ncbi:histone [Candidatus Aerophobetes bacterium]|uniref:Histone n=1 Tax=Aerophobetes bacterium TaxID=2030807 RepID=A0A2A4WXX5_UNCAE|nr:MAG: histone [Candidatus Aerophobetes bacterium]
MVLKTTTKNMEKLLQVIMVDLAKSDRNKAAAQRVRTNTVKLQKTAKTYRKESMDAIKPSVKKSKAAKKSKSAKKRPVARKNVASSSSKRAVSKKKRARA